MSATTYDAIIIGAGQAGPPLAERLTKAGQRVALIERKHPGGTCVNTGCTPTKALVASARAAHMARRAADFGVEVGEVRVDMKRVKARMDEIFLPSREGVTRWLEGMEGLSFLRGHAHFVGERRVAVGDEELEADRIFINTGARARRPGFSEGLPVWTNSDMMEVDHLPAHLVIIGGSYIGLEFAQMYRRFGAEVTVVEKGPRIIGREDEDVSAAVLAALESEGVGFRLNAECIALREKHDGFIVGVDCPQGPPEIEAPHVLLAVGRTPNTDELGLENTSVELDGRGFIKVDDKLRTAAEGVWALGEVNGRGAFTHTSFNDHEIVAENLLDGADRRVEDRHLIYGLFIDPPLGRVGMSLAQARESGREVLVGELPMKRVSRARERSETTGLIRLLVDGRTERFLGATVFGIGGDEVVHLIADLMYADAPYETLRRAVHIHPTVSELLPTIVGSLKSL